jgi:hypothetical protein
VNKAKIRDVEGEILLEVRQWRDAAKVAVGDDKTEAWYRLWVALQRLNHFILYGELRD